MVMSSISLATFQVWRPRSTSMARPKSRFTCQLHLPGHFQMLLVVTPWEKILFKLMSSLDIGTIFGTNSSKSQSLTEWNWSLTMLRMTKSTGANINWCKKVVWSFCYYTLYTLYIINLFTNGLIKTIPFPKYRKRTNFWRHNISGDKFSRGLIFMGKSHIP